MVILRSFRAVVLRSQISAILAYGDNSVLPDYYQTKINSQPLGILAGKVMANPDGCNNSIINLFLTFIAADIASAWQDTMATQD